MSFIPSIKLTDNIRLINTLSYSKVTSTIDLVPFTTQQGEEEGEEGGVAEGFLRDTLDSDVRSLNFSSILSIRPLSDVRLNIKYKYNTYENDTPKIEEPLSYVMLDGSSTLYPRIPRYMSYNTKTLGLDGDWAITNRLSLDAGIESKDTGRDFFSHSIQRYRITYPEGSGIHITGGGGIMPQHTIRLFMTQVVTLINIHGCEPLVSLNVILILSRQE